jgi:ABC-type transport system substrate-binding protein
VTARPRRGWGIVAAVALVAAACGPNLSPSVSPTQPSPSPSASPTPSPYADTITIGVLDNPFGLANEALGLGEGPLPILVTFLYDGLYRWDDRYRPVPNLAAEPCDVGGDGLTITCRLIEASFHDGAPFTADDVVLTYQLAASSACPFGDLCGPDSVLDSVTATDPRTVAFRLARPYAPFLTEVLPNVLIEPQHAIRAAYTRIRAGAEGVGPEEIRAVAGSLRADLDAEYGQQARPPDCTGILGPIGDLLSDVGVDLAAERRAAFVGADGELDACAYGEELYYMASSVADMLGETSEVEAIARIHWLLPLATQPVGTGPWALEEYTANERLVLKADPHHHGGPPATSTIVVRIFTGESIADRATQAVAALGAGEIDWLRLFTQGPGASEGYRGVAALPGIQLADYPTQFTLGLWYDLRPGRLFADRNLRKAVELCVDKPATVESATGGRGIPIWADVPPDSWAYEPGLPKLPRDVDAARRLIESSGWLRGPNGMYEMGGRRLATTVYVDTSWPERPKFMQLVALQLRDCGIELTVETEGYGPWVFFWPWIPPGAAEPVDARFFGYFVGAEGYPERWASGQIVSDDLPAGLNQLGFSDPRVDELVALAMRTYDPDLRADQLREIQRILADDAVALFAFNPRGGDALGPGIGSLAGPLDLASGRWYWPIEQLVRRNVPVP